MTLVHILSDPMTTQNVRGFLTPLLLNRSRLSDLGIALRFFASPRADIAACDVLMINAKYYGTQWNDAPEQILKSLAKFGEQAGAILYCDNYDSTAPIRTEVLPHISMYFKNMLLRDRSLYAKPFYGNRIFTDFYHHQDGINDRQPQCATPITDPSSLAKLCVSWNYGLANYGFLGSRVAALYGRLPAPLFLRFPVRFVEPSASRTIDVSLRGTANYSRETVAWHRKAVWERLGNRVATGRLSRGAFFRELSHSKVVVSPFGWGEFSLRDFEVFLCGALLFKPDMSHLETYPNFYRDGETIVTHRWDFSDIDEKLDGVLSGYDSFVDIARSGQNLYRYYLTAREAKEEFAERFQMILRKALSMGVEPNNPVSG